MMSWQEAGRQRDRQAMGYGAKWELKANRHVLLCCSAALLRGLSIFCVSVIVLVLVLILVLIVVVVAVAVVVVVVDVFVSSSHRVRSPCEYEYEYLRR